MILDERLEFADAAAIALAVGNAILPNSDVIDLGATPTLRDLGAGEPLWLVLQVDTVFGDTGAAGTGYVTIDLVSDSAAALTTSKTTHWTSGAIIVGTWVAGYTIAIPLPSAVTYERYLGLWMTVGTTNIISGKLNAFLTHDVAKYTAYPNAI